MDPGRCWDAVVSGPSRGIGSASLALAHPESREVSPMGGLLPQDERTDVLQMAS
jgi:hypothetical protein